MDSTLSSTSSHATGSSMALHYLSRRPVIMFNPSLKPAVYAPLSFNNRSSLISLASVSLPLSSNDPSDTTVDDAAVSAKQLKPRVGTASEQGSRESMEDMIQIIENAPCGFLYATVYDGHAGISAAEYLHKNLFGVINNFLKNQNLGFECALDSVDEGLCCPISMHSILTDSYQKADADLLRYLGSVGGDTTECGCTATTVLVRDDRVVVANVGDSRAVMSRKGTAVDLSTEHRVYGRGPVVQAEIERVEASGGWVDDGRVCGVLAVSRAFGDPDFKGGGLKQMMKRGVEEGIWDEKFASRVFTADPVISEPDVLEMAVNEDDEFIVVATDGLWDVIGSQDVVNLVRTDLRKGLHVQDVAQRLANVALKRYTADNVAVVIIDMKGEQGWAAAGGGKQSGKKMFGWF